MSAWGRGGSSPQGIAAIPSRRLARRSVICAVVAYTIALAVLIAFVTLPSKLPLPWETLAPIGLSIVFAIIVPVIHIVGLVYGARAFGAPDERRGIAVLGIVLNLLAIGAVLVGIWAVLGLSGAYT